VKFDIPDRPRFHGRSSFGFPISAFLPSLKSGLAFASSFGVPVPFFLQFDFTLFVALCFDCVS